MAISNNNVNSIEYVSLLLHGDGINNAQNDAFRDSSSNDHTITPVGTVTQGSFSPFGDLWSNYFNGTTDYLDCGTPVLNTTGDFTIECWIYVTEGSGTIRNIVNQYVAGNANRTTFWVGPSNKLEWSTVGATPELESLNTIPTNTWTHVCIVRNGSGTNNVSMYVDGVVQSSYTDTANFAQTNTWIGQGPSFSAGLFVGYISNLRINTSAVYTSNFTPPTSNLTAVAGTVLLTCQSNTFEDNSTNNFAITVNGTPSVVPNSPFKPTIAYSPAIHGGSGYITGNSYFRAPLASLPFTDDTWTIECWVYMSTVAANNPICCASDLMVFNLTPTQLQLSWRPAAGGWLGFTANYAFEANNWYHVSVSRDNGAIRFSVNGVVMTATGVAVDGAQGGQSTAFFYIGASDDFPFSGTMNNYLAGYISGFRVTNNVLYPAGFNPPTAPPTNSAATSLLLNFTNAGIFDSVRKHDIRVVGDAKISTAVTKYGSGSIYFDGNNDYLVIIPNNNELVYGTGSFTIECWYNFRQVGPSNVGIIISQAVFGNNNLLLAIDNNRAVIAWLGNSNLGTSSAGVVPLNTWCHIALVRNGSNVTVYVDGLSVLTATNSSSIGGSMVTCINGYGHDTTFGNECYIDDLRITKGVAVYTSNSSTINVTLSPTTYPEEILRTDCLGDSRIKINNNFNNFKSAVIALRTGVPGGTWSVNLGTMMPLSGSHCIGDSLLTINQNIALLKGSLQEIKTEAGSLLSGCSIEFDEITQIAPNECIGDSRNKLNYIFDFLLSVQNCFDSYI